MELKKSTHKNDKKNWLSRFKSQDVVNIRYLF